MNPQRNSGDGDAFAKASQYYTTGANAKPRTRTYTRPELGSKSEIEAVLRRASHEDKSKARKFLINVEDTRKLVLEREDTDNDFQITVNDLGPKTLALGTADSGGFRKIGIRGNYMLSNLLQELTLASDYGRQYIVLDEDRLNENAVDRLSRMIKHIFWDNLVRCIDAEGLDAICADTKSHQQEQERIYIPHGLERMYQYYVDTTKTYPHLKDLVVEYLPEHITPAYVRDINTRPGLLALNMVEDEHGGLKGCPFVVPGGRFNEMYGWDSYFEVLGLLVDHRIGLAKSMTENFAFEIKHYGKILNANRSYYLCRSQPPFLTDMALRIYAKMDPDNPASKQWLRSILQSAIKEYHQVWMAAPRLDPLTQLSRYRPDGLGIPPETEASHFDHIIEKYAKPRGLSIQEYGRRYTAGEIKEPELDEYFLHDRAVRESGHDTTYRFEGVCANLATIDLNALLYKYEMDLAHVIDDVFDDGDDDSGLVDMDTGEKQTSSVWFERALQRKQRINRYLWNDKDGLYYDYDTVKQEQATYESATAFWALWAGCASASQAEELAAKSLFKFETKGGLVSGTENSRGAISLDRPNRQWDFPFGWAPHQILAWEGFERYGMKTIASRLAYRWLYMITKSFVEFNGVVPEKFDVVALSHKVEVEYGNQGTDFKYVPREGFGWMNASYEVGQTYLNTRLIRALGTLIDPDELFAKDLAHEEQLRSPAMRAQANARRRMSTIAAHDLVAESPDATTTTISAGHQTLDDSASGASNRSPSIRSPGSPHFLDVDYSQPHISPSQENLDQQYLAP